MIGFDWGIAAAAIVAAEDRIVRKAQETMSPEAFREWSEKREAHRTAERRHRELCQSIERAGHNARPLPGRLW